MSSLESFCIACSVIRGKSEGGRLAANYEAWVGKTEDKDIVARIEHELACDKTLVYNEKVHIYNIFKDAANEIKSLRKQVHALGPRLREGTAMKVRFKLNQESKFLADCFTNHLIDKAQSCPLDMTSVDVIVRVAAPGVDKIFPCVERHGGTVIKIGEI
jgi:hypothetical protein